MKIRIIKENTQPFEGKTKYFLKENVVEIDIDDKWRPQNWEDDRFHECINLTKDGGYYANPYDVFEAGATATLKALSQFLKEKLNIE